MVWLDFFILVKDFGVYTKEGNFFQTQGGLTQEWGKTWEEIDVGSLSEARRIAYQRRRERYPNAFKGFDEP